MYIALFYSINRDCEQEGGLYGGPGGGFFDDGCDLGRITRVSVYEGSFIGVNIIVAIVVDYEGGSTTHGVPDAEPAEIVIDLADDEAIIAVVGNAGDNNGEYVNMLGFVVMAEDGTTTLYGPVGDPYIGENFIFCGEIRSFRGRSGSAIDSIGFNTA